MDLLNLIIIAAACFLLNEVAYVFLKRLDKSAKDNSTKIPGWLLKIIRIPPIGLITTLFLIVFGLILIFFEMLSKKS